MKKKVISVFMCMCMVFSLYIPTGITANAKEVEQKLVNTSSLTKVDGLETKKAVSDNDDGSYKISLEAYTTGQVSAVPTDVVLVLDQSGSMKDEYTTRDIYNKINNKNNYWYRNNEIYYLANDDNYHRVIVKYEFNWNTSTYSYYYENADGSNVLIEESKSNDGNPKENYYAKSIESISKSDALKESAQRFTNTLSSYAIENKVNHRVGIVTYGDDANELLGFISLYDANDSTQQENGIESINKAIKNLPDMPAGATNVSEGMSKVKTMFDKEKNNESNRQKIIIVFTDGVPTVTSNFSINVAKNAILTAKALKELNAKIFTVGIFQGADISELYGEKYDRVNWFGIEDTYCTGNIGSTWGISDLNDLVNRFTGNDFKDPDVAAGNRFLNFLSSNYLKTTSVGLKKSNEGYGYEIDENFERNSTDYYYTADDLESLNSVFNNIAQQIIVPAYRLDSSSVVYDTITEYFDLVDAEQTDCVKVYTQKAIGVDNQGKILWDTNIQPFNQVAQINGKTISVTGFDFNENCVTKTLKPGSTSDDPNYGRKLIIEFNIKPIEGFIGGNQVPTNADSSGVYLDNKVVENFDVPTVDVPISNYKFDAQDQSIYVSNEANLSDVLNYTDTTTVNGITNKFVNICYTLSDGNGSIATYTINAGKLNTDATWTDIAWPKYPQINKVYTLSCKIVATNNKIDTPDTETFSDLVSQEAYVYVFTPTIYVKDSTANYGDTVDLNGNIANDSNVDKVTWNCKCSSAKKPSKDVPKLSYNFTNTDTKEAINENDEYQMLQDTNFKISSVKANGDNIPFESFNESSNTSPKDEKFKIILNRFDLTIDKTVVGNVIDQPFVINVESNIDGEGKKVYPITILPTDFSNNKARKTIKGLYCGVNYAVTEDANWSWRFEPQVSSQTVRSDTNGDIKRVDIVNSRTKTKWFSGDAIARNEGTQSVWNRVANTVLPIVS